ncbi:MAG: Lrp/AsnC ligand binding domain-containing protein [Chloroflexi bacterium]|nr:Lrp/AsnC ligand binding domain-containing protein [Chloroflexota bacterium]
MELKEVLAQVPGLRKRFVHYLESQGHIAPRKIQKTRIARRDYSASDLAVIREVWQYAERGYSVQAAFDLIASKDRFVCYVLLSVPARKWAQVTEALRSRPEVLEATVVYGDPIDAIILADAPQEGDIFQALMPILGELGVAGSPVVLRTGHRMVKPGSSKNGMLAYVLMTVPTKEIERVLEEVQAFDEIREASAVYGQSDIVLKVDVPTQDLLDDLVMRRLHAVEGVESTRTFIGIGGLHWSRGTV